MKEWSWLIFVAGTAMCWGAYVPFIHEGQAAIGGGRGPLRAFLCVGVAYFVTAVVVPLLLIWNGAEPLEFKGRGVGLATFAGVLGACGALGVILALKAGGRPVYVAPLVFGVAPIVNVIISLAWHPPKSPPQPMFFVGIVLAAVGTALVLRYKP